METNKIYEGDCLELMPQISDKSIDMILCDLPYGVTSRNNWDVVIPFDLLWSQYERIIKDNGVVALTAIQPFSSEIVLSNKKLFKYEWIWKKQQGTGFLNAKKQPLRNHEQILVFYKKQPIYNPQFTKGIPYKCQSGRATTNYREQVSVLTENEGKRYPLTVQEFQYDKQKLHPTQKPVALFEYLIKTYTNEGDLVLDNAAGSCTTAIACENLKRNWICMEKENNYCEIGRKRVEENRQNLFNND